MKPKYILNYTKVAEKFFQKHEKVRTSFKEGIRKLIENDHPEQVDYKGLKGKWKGYYRIRIDDYRVVFTYINGKVIVISVILAGPRGDVYKKLK